MATTMEMERASRTGAGPGVKLFYGVCGAAVLAYMGLLFARGNGVGWTWLDGWGVASFEALMSVMILGARLGQTNSRYCLWLGLGGLAWAAGRLRHDGRDAERCHSGHPVGRERALVRILPARLHRRDDADASATSRS